MKRGREIGVVRSQEECEKHVLKFKGALFKSFGTMEEAVAYLAGQVPCQFDCSQDILLLVRVFWILSKYLKFLLAEDLEVIAARIRACGKSTYKESLASVLELGFNLEFRWDWFSGCSIGQAVAGSSDVQKQFNLRVWSVCLLVDVLKFYLS